MSDVTQILQQLEQGDTEATDRLLPLVYEELKHMAAAKMASERPDHTLQATALVNEAYLRLVDAEQVQPWESRGHFFSAAAEAMRRILVDHARRKSSQKRGGKYQRVDTDQLTAGALTDPDLLIDIDEGISRMAKEDPKLAELVKLRLFAGLSVSESGELLGISRDTAYQNWKYVRTWFAANDPERP